MKLFHTANLEIKKPDVHYGRVNADFGQGFYTSSDVEFSSRWGRVQKDAKIYLNSYELDETGLKILKLNRDKEWASYIFNNRAAKSDYYGDYDVITGPIANDTIFNTYGIITSGFLSIDEALKLLLEGPCFIQVVLKTELAVSQLKFIKSEIIPDSQIIEASKAIKKEEESYLDKIAEIMEEF